MAQLQFLHLVILLVISLGTRSCYSQSSTPQETTLPGLHATLQNEETSLANWQDAVARVQEKKEPDLQNVQRNQENTPASAPSSFLKEEEDNSRYKTLEANATLLKLLVDDKDGVSRSEVFDMLHSRDDNEDHIDLPRFPEDAEVGRVEVPIVPDSQAEFLQAPGESIPKDSQRVRLTSGRGGEPIGAAAGIMVIITCSIVCLAYIGLIVWRRIYLKRNGLKHELLRNEENIAETRIEL